MSKRYTAVVTAATFFCAGGWIYDGPAMGAQAEEPAGPVKPATPSLFDNATDTQPAADAADAKAPAKDDAKGPVAVGTFGQIDLHVKDLELSKVLQLLSIQSQRNIIASKTVSGAVTADLYGVDFYEALDAILQPNGFGYREKGNFIYVYTAQEMKAFADAERKTSAKLIRLNYITAADASTFVTPLLSKDGAISISAPTSSGMAPSATDAGADSSAAGPILVVRDYDDNIKQIADVLKELDARPKQVLVEATVLEATLDEANGWGSDLTILADFNMAAFTNPISAISDLISGTVKPAHGAGSAIQTGTASSDLKTKSALTVGVVSDNVSAFIYALDQVTHTTVLAHPKLLVLNRQKADLLVGQRIAYLSTTTTSTSATQTVEYLNTGTQLTLRPFVSDDGMIRMELRPSISTGKLRDVGSTQVPDESTEELTTNVMVQNGQTVVLGGLFKETTTVGRKQVPGLGDVPIIGAGFKGQDDSVNRSEVIFLLTPTIIKDQALYATGSRAQDSVELARIGARAGLLPWSNSKLSAVHMRDALKFYEEGDKEKALWSVNMALFLDKNMTEARRLKETITGERLYETDQSLLRDALNQMVDKKLGAHAHAEGATTQPATVADATGSEPGTNDATVKFEVSGKPAAARIARRGASSRPVIDEAIGTVLVPTAPVAVAPTTPAAAEEATTRPATTPAAVTTPTARAEDSNAANNGVMPAADKVAPADSTGNTETPSTDDNAGSPEPADNEK